MGTKWALGGAGGGSKSLLFPTLGLSLGQRGPQEPQGSILGAFFINFSSFSIYFSRFLVIFLNFKQPLIKSSWRRFRLQCFRRNPTRNKKTCKMTAVTSAVNSTPRRVAFTAVSSAVFLRNATTNNQTCEMTAKQCNAMRCDAMQCNAMQCNAMQCNVMQCNAPRCDAMRCNAMQCE